MALIQCNRCGSMVANTGKCPKCGALLCKECGHEVGAKDVRCPNCGKGTVYLSGKIKTGYYLICIGVLFVLLVHFFFGTPYTSYEAFMNLCIFLGGAFFLISGIFHVVKYGKIKHFS